MQSQGMAPIALIPLTVQPLIPFGQAMLLANWAQTQGSQASVARNGNIIVGNLGVVTTGAQTASPTNIIGP